MVTFTHKTYGHIVNAQFVITLFSTADVKFDRCADDVPGLNVVTNTVDIFLKCVYRPCVGENNLQTSHYLTYLELSDPRLQNI